MTVTVSKVGTARANILVAQTPVLVATLDAVVQEMQTLKNKAETVGREGTARLEDETAHAEEKLTQARKGTLDHRDALTFMKSQLVKDARSQYLQVRHQIVKIQGYLTTVNFRKKYAKLLAERLHKLGVLNNESAEPPVADGIEVDADGSFSSVLLVTDDTTKFGNTLIDVANQSHDEAMAKASKGELAMHNNRTWMGCLQAHRYICKPVVGELSKGFGHADLS